MLSSGHGELLVCTEDRGLRNQKLEAVGRGKGVNRGLCETATLGSAGDSKAGDGTPSEKVRYSIFDLGMNNGDDTAYYLSLGNRVLAVEANPKLAEDGRKRFEKEIDSGRLRILNLGVAAEEGFFDFWVCRSHSQYSSFDRKSASRDGLDHYSIQVRTIKPATLFKEYGVPDYLKIDIEGSELLCLEELSRHPLPKYLSVECDSRPHVYKSDYGLALLRALSNVGYQNFKLVNQYTFCSVSKDCSLSLQLDSFAREVLASPLNRVAGVHRISRWLVRTRMERRFGKEFPIGTSGPWGEDTVGPWLSYRDAEETYQYYRTIHTTDAGSLPFPFWYDWHARS